MKKETLYCDICGKEIKRTDEVQMSISIEKKSFIWDGLGLTVVNEDYKYIKLKHPMFGCINIYRLHVHKLQHAIIMLEVDDKAKIVIR